MGSYEDELIWSAAWLYKATGKADYLSKAEQMYASRAQTWTSWAFDWSDKLPGAQLLLIRSQARMSTRMMSRPSVTMLWESRKLLEVKPIFLSGDQTDMLQTLLSSALGLLMLASKLQSTLNMLINRLDTCWVIVGGAMLWDLVLILPNSLTTRQLLVRVPQPSAPGTPSVTPPGIIPMSCWEPWWGGPAMSGTAMWLTEPTTSPMRSLWTTMQDSREL